MPEPSRPNIFEMQSQSAGTLLTPLRDNPVNALPRWIKTHLLVGRITLFIMVVIGGPALIAFGIMTRNDLRDDHDDSACRMKFIQDADKPWDDGPGMSFGPGRYHTECRLLLSWSYIMVVAGSLSVGRLIPEFLIPYDAPLLSPSRVYIAQTMFSLIPCCLYICCAVILGINPAIVGPRAEYGYGEFYIIPLVCVCLAILTTAQQSFATVMASWRLVGWQKYQSIPGGV